MLLHRVLTALVGVPAVLAAVWFGPPWLTVLAVVAAVIGVREAYRMYPGAAMADAVPAGDAVPTPDSGLRRNDGEGGNDGDGDGAMPAGDSGFRWNDGEEDSEAHTSRLPILLGGAWAVALVLAGELAGSAADLARAAVAICVVGVIIGGLWMIAGWHGRRPAVAALYLMAAPVYIGGALACAVALRGIVGGEVELPLSLPADGAAATDGPLPGAPQLVDGNEIAEIGAPPPAMVGAGDGADGDTRAGGVWLLPAVVGAGFAVNAANLTDAGGWWLLLGILVVYAADTGAYVVGRLIGRHPMAPGISPGKSWEGAAGGMAGAVIAAVVLGALLPIRLQIWQLAGIGVILGIVAPLGDLLESKIKRWAGVKDSGRLLPGHGGMLDRLDSLLPSLIVVYLLALWWRP